MAKFLHIETSTTMCSVALSENDVLLGFKEINSGYTHAENLHVFIQQLLKEQNCSVTDLNGVAVSKGPGSYTGLRIGVSAAKGMAFALNIPLIAIDTLKLMTVQAKKIIEQEGQYCPMLDARRMEVYTATYTENLELLGRIEALIINETSVEKFSEYSNPIFFGDGMPKCKNVLKTIKNIQFLENIVPRAQDMVTLVWEKFQTKKFEDLAYFEPFYLKDFLILKKSL